MVSPVTVIGDDEPTSVIPPGFAVTIYPFGMMAEPPVLAGAVKVTVACWSPGVAVPMVGAAGTIALTVKLRVTVEAAFVDELPAWSASMVQVPAEMKVNTPLLVMVQTPVVDEVKSIAKPVAAPPIA